MQLQEQTTITRLPATRIKSYDAAIKAFNRAMAGQAITEQSVIEYLQGLQKAGYKPATVNHKIQALKKSLHKMAERQGQDSSLIKYRIDQAFKQPELKSVKIDKSITDQDVLTPEELRRIIEIATPKTGLLIEALYQTAARVSELLNIRLADCKARRGPGAIEVSITGKGKKQRKVFITTALYERIRDTYQGKKFLFESETGQQLNRQNVHKQIKRAAAAAGIAGLHPHTIRHTWATHNLDRLGIHKVSKYLGHSDIAITSAYYLHNQASAEEILQGELFNDN